MHYYQHHIGDFIKDTARLSDGQAMAYLRLIWRYYDQEAPIADEIDVVAFQLGVSESDVSLILRSFFVLQDDGWHQTRCDAEILKFHEYSAKQSENGKKGGRPRKEKPTDNPPLNDGLPTDNPPQSQRKAKQKPTESQKKPNQQPYTHIKTSMSATADVEDVFAYWQRVMDSPNSKLDAGRQKIISARLKDGYTVDDLKRAIDGCRASKFHMGENPNGKKYNGIDLIFRSADKVDGFADGTEGASTSAYDHIKASIAKDRAEDEKSRQEGLL